MFQHCRLMRFHLALHCNIAIYKEKMLGEGRKNALHENPTLILFWFGESIYFKKTIDLIAVKLLPRACIVVEYRDVCTRQASNVRLITVKITVVLLMEMNIAEFKIVVNFSLQGTQEQCIQVITHLERIIKVQAKSLNKENKRRRIPRQV